MARLSSSDGPVVLDVVDREGPLDPPVSVDSRQKPRPVRTIGPGRTISPPDDSQVDRGEVVSPWRWSGGPSQDVDLDVGRSQDPAQVVPGRRGDDFSLVDGCPYPPPPGPLLAPPPEPGSLDPWNPPGKSRSDPGITGSLFA
jgi:hypothetical protein